jgi:hypothetical protein
MLASLNLVRISPPSRSASVLKESRGALRMQGMSYKASYTVAMADTITFRPDEDTSKALEVLTKDGTAVSVAVRSALIDAARRKAGAAIRAEAERLAEDKSDRAEAMQVLRDMETLRAW